MELKDIDAYYDVRSDSRGKDPDLASDTLRTYHQLLWSKPLPNGETMQLTHENCSYLRWRDIYVSSDSIIISFHNRYKALGIVEQDIPDFSSWREDYLRKTYVIGGSIIFPQHPWSMNQARGCSRKIVDRWDLTLECIRKFYLGEPTPLDKALQRGKPFFDLFVDFKGYIDYFFLQDCVDENYRVKMMFDSPLWDTDPFPRNVNDYLRFIDKELDFLNRRTQRIIEYCNHLEKK